MRIAVAADELTGFAPGAARGASPARPRAGRLRMALATNIAVVAPAGVIAVVLLVLALQRGV